MSVSNLSFRTVSDWAAAKLVTDDPAHQEETQLKIDRKGYDFSVLVMNSATVLLITTVAFAAIGLIGFQMALVLGGAAYLIREEAIKNVIDYQIRPLAKRIEEIQERYRNEGRIDEQALALDLRYAENSFKVDIRNVRETCLNGDWSNAKDGVVESLHLINHEKWNQFTYSWNGTPIFMNMLPDQTPVEAVAGISHGQDPEADDEVSPLRLNPAYSSVVDLSYSGGSCGSSSNSRFQPRAAADLYGFSGSNGSSGSSSSSK